MAALSYSLIESAKLCGVEPRAYLWKATLRAVRNPGTITLARDLKSPRKPEKNHPLRTTVKCGASRRDFPTFHLKGCVALFFCPYELERRDEVTVGEERG